jgi:hypothetical protein
LTLTDLTRSFARISRKVNRTPNDRSGDGASPAQRLQAFLAAKQLIVFEDDIRDKEYPYIRCSMWGAIPTNELFVRLTNGEVTFVDCVPSPLEVPVMADRMFGMDVFDAQAAGALADAMWERHKHQLIHPGIEGV